MGGAGRGQLRGLRVAMTYAARNGQRLENQIMKFAICKERFEGWAFEDMCRASKGAGYDGIEVAPVTLAPRITDVTAPRRAERRGQAAAAGVEIIGLHWLLAGTQGLYLTSPDQVVRDQTAEY